MIDDFCFKSIDTVYLSLIGNSSGKITLVVGNWILSLVITLISSFFFGDGIGKIEGYFIYDSSGVINSSILESNGFSLSSCES